VRGENLENWQKLCTEAASERDPVRIDATDLRDRPDA